MVVFERVRRRLPRVSLATVYRNLRRLAAEGLLQERVR
jgi:Fe2+ or Zn2+ uptake regulation protein